MSCFSQDPYDQYLQNQAFEYTDELPIEKYCEDCQELTDDCECWHCSACDGKTYECTCN